MVFGEGARVGAEKDFADGAGDDGLGGDSVIFPSLLD